MIVVVYIEHLATPYILHAQTTIIVRGNFVYSTKYCEYNNSKCCPALPEAWVPTFTGIHA